MKTWTEDPLLTAVLADGLPAEFSAGLLAQTLREVRRQRRRVAAQRGLGVVALALVAFVTVQNWLSRTTVGELAAATSAAVVHTRPLPAGMIVTSTFSSVDLMETRADSVAKVETSPADRLFEWLDDAGLFVMAGDRPVGLVRLEDHTAQLVWPGVVDVVLR